MNGACRTVIVGIDAATDFVSTSEQHTASQYELRILLNLESESLTQSQLTALRYHDKTCGNLAYRTVLRHDDTWWCPWEYLAERSPACNFGTSLGCEGYQRVLHGLVGKG